MANINDVIGTILQNISEARSSSDNLSKHLSQKYYEDPILRLFTVPRTQIQDIEIDLKFSIKSVDPRKDIQVNKIARKNALINETTRRFLSHLSDEIDANVKDEEELKKIAEQLDSVKFRDKLQSQLSNELNQKIDFEDLNLDVFDTQVKQIFDVGDVLTGKFTRSTVFDFTVLKDRDNNFSFEVEDEKNGLIFRNDRKFGTEEEAVKAAMEVIEKGTVKANYTIERQPDDSSKVLITLKEANRVLARSEVIRIDSAISADDSSIRSTFIDNSGLISRLRKVKRTNAFREISSSGRLPVVQKLNISPLVEKSIVQVLPDLRKEIQAISKGIYDYTIDAAVDAESLAELPESSISNIRLKAGINDLSWTRILRDDGTESIKLLDDSTQ